MSIEQQNRIEALERRLSALEEQFDLLTKPTTLVDSIASPPAVSGDPSLHKTGTMTLPEKRKSA